MGVGCVCVGVTDRPRYSRLQINCRSQETLFTSVSFITSSTFWSRPQSLISETGGLTPVIYHPLVHLSGLSRRRLNTLSSFRPLGRVIPPSGGGHDGTVLFSEDRAGRLGYPGTEPASRR